MRIDKDLQEYYYALQEKENIEEADIVRLLDAYRIKFKVDVVYVAETLVGRKGFAFTHVSFLDEKYNLKGQIHAVSDEMWSKLLVMYDEDGLCENNAYPFMEETDYGLLCYGILRDGEHDGDVGMIDFCGKRDWTTEERAAIQKLGRVLKYVIFTERCGRVNAACRERLENQNQMLEAIFSSTDCGMIRHTVNGNRILGINRAALKILGYGSKAELEEAGFDRIAASVAEEDKARLRECLRQLRKVGDSADIEYRVCHKDGTILDVSGKIQLLMENGELVYQRILFDRTSQKTSEEMEQWEEKKQHYEMIQALCEEYSSVYFVDLDTGMAVPYSIDEEVSKYYKILSGKIVFAESMMNYINDMVYDVDKEFLYMMSSVQHLRMELEEQNCIHVNYRIMRDGEVEYYQMKAVRTGGWKNGKHRAVIGFHSVDDDIRSEISQKELIEESYEIISGLSSDYNFIGLINCETGKMSVYKASDESPEVITLASKTNYFDAISEYERYVHDDDKAMWKNATKLDYVLKELQDKSIYNVNLRNNAEKPDYIQFRFTRIQEADYEYQLVLAKRIITETIKKEMEQRMMLEEALKQAEYANQAKSKFLSNMSHDIRTPINGIMGMEHIAINALDDPARVADCLHKIRESSEHLLGLINDVLDMSRIESGKVSLNHEFMDMNLMIERCVVIIQGQLVDREIEFIREIPELRRPYRVGDELRLRQILVNILGNAVKFTPDGGKIIFRVKEYAAADKDNANIRFEVEDTGVGMEPEYLDRIWEPFSQADQGSRTNYKGTGLGMSITKQFVDVMGGSITVESQLNVGSKFIVVLPVEITDFEPPAEDEPVPRNLEGMKVLVVEDNELNMEIIKCVLEEEKIEVFTAENGRRAVEMFTESEPGDYDLILMDIMMPDMDGLEATRTIRASGHPSAATVPIIAMTANAYDEDVKKTKKAGMNAHLTKPLDIPVMVALLSEYYGK